MHDIAQTNHLIHETSPYLLQHAHNPVNWYAWNNEVLGQARTKHKPILLSIGYSACHWCHVMAHESFEDAETAALMNKLFVNIKVDREERPDLDRVYQLVHQVLTQRGGGWPLTVFLTPDDLAPFFVGTYFPREPRYGTPAFKEVLTRVATFYRDHPDELHKQNAALRDIFKRIEGETDAQAAELNDAPLKAAFHSLSESFDSHYGGFSRAPKFPQSTGLEFLLWRAADPKMNVETAQHSRHMLETTLTRMAEGGLYDQLGGGFYRYSTDEEWTIPHFEKMLYDNGPLLALYAQAAKFTPVPPRPLKGEGETNKSGAPEQFLFQSIAKQSAEWIMAEMQSPLGGYYSSLDADSEGHEGKYYIWDQEEVRALLSAEEFSLFAPRYGLNGPPNFEDHWHLHIHQPIANITARLNNDENEVKALFKSACSKLLAARQKRMRPDLDDKVLTAWNGLMIRGMVLAGRLLDEPRFIESARRSVDFLRTHVWKDSRLMATWRGGQTKLPAYLDDYAFLLSGALELLQTHWDSGLFDFARQLADVLLTLFEDKQHGGFWFTSNDHRTPLYRSKTFGDESLPAGNAIAAHTLLHLGHLCAEPRYLDAAEHTLKAALPSMTRYPEGHAAMLLALKDALEPPTMVVLRGTPEKLSEWCQMLNRRFDPRRMILAIPGDVEHLTGLLEQCKARDDICAYTCRGTQCSLPITNPASLSAI